MIRFCDKEVYCAIEGNLDRSELISFLNGKENDVVCALDDKGRFIFHNEDEKTKFRRWVQTLASRQL